MADIKVLLLLILAVSVQFSVCLGDDIVEQAKEGAQQAQEKTESWAGWAYDKVASNLGLKQEEKQEPVENVKMQTRIASEKVGQAKDAIKDRILSSVQSDHFAAENKEKLKEEMEEIKAKTASAYEEAKHKLGAASDGAKAHSEAAMEKAKQAAHELNPAKAE